MYNKGATKYKQRSELIRQLYYTTKTDGLEKIADFSELSYYSDNYKEQMIYKIALKIKSEFGIVYANDWEAPKLVIKSYKAK